MSTSTDWTIWESTYFFKEIPRRIEQSLDASRVYRVIAKDRTISFLSQEGKWDITENEEDRIHPLFKIHFLGSYSKAGDNNNIFDTPITEQKRKKENWKIAEEVCSEVRARWSVRTFKRLISSTVNDIFPVLLLRVLESVLDNYIRTSVLALNPLYPCQNACRAKHMYFFC